MPPSAMNNIVIHLIETKLFKSVILDVILSTTTVVVGSSMGHILQSSYPKISLQPLLSILQQF